VSIKVVAKCFVTKAPRSTVHQEIDGPNVKPYSIAPFWIDDCVDHLNFSKVVPSAYGAKARPIVCFRQAELIEEVQG
jgi:hypothetical protein